MERIKKRKNLQAGGADFIRPPFFFSYFYLPLYQKSPEIVGHFYLSRKNRVGNEYGKRGITSSRAFRIHGILKEGY
jgi:hypothetical protein